MFVSLSCSLSLPSKKGYLGSRAIFLLPLSLPPRRLRRGALTSGEGCCSLYSLPAGEGERRCFSSSSVMFFTARGGAVARGRSRVWSGLPGTAIPAPVPPGVAALGGWRDLPRPAGKESLSRPGGGRGSTQLSPYPEHSDLPAFPCLRSGFSRKQLCWPGIPGKPGSEGLARLTRLGLLAPSSVLQ